VPFHAIEGIERPFLVLFFVLAGASLDVSTLARVGGIGAGYVALRSAGKVLGARLGAELGGADPLTCRWIGLGLLPQAGVAMGMALVASHRLPMDPQLLLSIVVSSTVLFELVGPVLVRLALLRFRAA
jgi:Kef-type K+ transport system membrane component KefB